MKFLWLFVPFISIGVNIHYLVNDPEGFFEGLLKSFAWIGGLFLLLIVLLITGNLD